MRGQQRGDDLRVRGRAEAHAPLAQLGVQLDGVDEVAVVAERELAAVGAVDGLRVVPAVGAGRGVAHVPDRDLAAERAQLLLVEDLVDEAEVAQGHDVPAYVRGGDAGGFLPAMLQCVQREVGQAGDVVAGRIDPEHSALVTRPLAAIERGHRHKDSLAFGGELASRCIRTAEAPDLHKFVIVQVWTISSTLRSEADEIRDRRRTDSGAPQHDDAHDACDPPSRRYAPGRLDAGTRHRGWLVLLISAGVQPARSAVTRAGRPRSSRS